ncbi:MAG TPA: ATP-binding cassette domain-containing protein, partial [Steroidobacteraceae bacterium]
MSESAAPGLAAAGLRISVGTRELVRGLSLAFAAGELVAILGRNGSGKTLTLHTLAGLRVPDGGEVLLDGTPV